MAGTGCTLLLAGERHRLKMSFRPLVKYWLPVIAWMVLIFLGSTDVLSGEHTSRFLVPFLRWLNPQISLSALVEIQFAIRKLGHLTEYAILAILVWRALRAGTVWTTKTSIVFGLTVLVCAIFAASDEFHQAFVPSRTSSPHDMMIDVCGALAGLMICLSFARRKSAPAVASSGK